MFLISVSPPVSAQKLVYRNQETRISMLPIWKHTDYTLNLLSSRIEILSNDGSKLVEIKVDAVPSHLQSWSRGICRERSSIRRSQEGYALRIEGCGRKFSMLNELKVCPTDILMRSKNFFARICNSEDLRTGTRYEIWFNFAASNRNTLFGLCLDYTLRRKFKDIKAVKVNDLSVAYATNLPGGQPPCGISYQDIERVDTCSLRGLIIIIIKNVI